MMNNMIVGEGMNNEFGIPSNGMTQQQRFGSQQDESPQDQEQPLYNPNASNLRPPADTDLRVPDITDRATSWDVIQVGDVSSESDDDVGYHGYNGRSAQGW